MRKHKINFKFKRLNNMKAFKRVHFIILIIAALSLQSCRLWEKVFPPKYGCKTNGGKNVGAEQLLEENTKAKKKKKTSKFKA